VLWTHLGRSLCQHHFESGHPSRSNGDGTTEGDSGSPVVTLNRTQLVGMHFAGFKQTSYMIPAYELVQRKNYVGFADGAPFIIN